LVHHRDLEKLQPIKTRWNDNVRLEMGLNGKKREKRNWKCLTKNVSSYNGPKSANSSGRKRPVQNPAFRNAGLRESIPSPPFQVPGPKEA